MSALRPIVYFGGLSVCGEEKNQMAFPSFASTREVLYGAGYVFDVSDGGNIETGVTRRSSLGALLCTPRVRMRW